MRESIVEGMQETLDDCTNELDLIGNLVASLPQESVKGRKKTGFLRCKSECTGFAGYSRIELLAESATLRKASG
jgi:hypothetical protein